MALKDPTPDKGKFGLIYHVNCKDCHNVYIGETGSSLHYRVNEHCIKPSLAVLQHHEQAKHRVDYEHPKILEMEDNGFRRMVKEEIYI